MLHTEYREEDCACRLKSFQEHLQSVMSRTVSYRLTKRESQPHQNQLHGCKFTAETAE